MEHLFLCLGPDFRLESGFSALILTIITPVFKGAAFLQACIENVASQWEEGIEHWIIDGGSLDGSPEILEKAAGRYSHLHYISEPDSGQSNAMNKGIVLAKGTWISFLNVDDFYEPGALKSVLALIRKSPDAQKVLVGDLKIWNSDGSLHSVNSSRSVRLASLIADRCEWPFNPSCYFYPKKIHDQTGLYAEKEHFAMDYDFILRISLARIPFEYHPGVWGNFRLLPTAKTSQDQSGNQSYLRAEALRDSYFKKLSIADQWMVRWLRLEWFLILKWRKFFPAEK